MSLGNTVVCTSMSRESALTASTPLEAECGVAFPQSILATGCGAALLQSMLAAGCGEAVPLSTMAREYVTVATAQHATHCRP